jgi:hypothetical protein
MGGGHAEHWADTVTGMTATEAKGTSVATRAAERNRFIDVRDVAFDVTWGAGVVRRSSDMQSPRNN